MLLDAAGPAPADPDTSPAQLWVGLKNSDDQGTRFDLRTALYVNDTLVAEGTTRCVTGITRNPAMAKDVSVPFGPISNGEMTSGDSFSLIVAAGSSKFKPWSPGNADGSGVVAGILYSTKDVTLADKSAVNVARLVEVNASELVWPVGANAATIALGLAALKALTIVPR